MYTLHATKYNFHNVTEFMYHVPALVTQRSYEPTHFRKHTSHFPTLGDINGGSVCANTNYAAVTTYIPIYYESLNHIINNTHMCILWVKRHKYLENTLNPSTCTNTHTHSLIHSLKFWICKIQYTYTVHRCTKMWIS